VRTQSPDVCSCLPSIVRISAWCTTRSISAVTVAALGKIVGQSLKRKLVVKDETPLFIVAANDLEEEVGGARAS
jgi:hypothetical protein